MKLKKVTIILSTILSLIVSFFILRNEFQSLDSVEEFFFCSLITIGFNILKLFLIGIGVFSIDQLRKKRQLIYLIPIIISLTTFIIVFIIWQKIEERESSPIVLKAHYDGDINGLTLTLKKNLTYKLEDFAFLGETDYFGNYTIKGDTILLSKKYPLGKDRDIMDNKLLRKIISF